MPAREAGAGPTRATGPVIAPTLGRSVPRWVLPQPVATSDVAALSDALHLPEPLCRLLCARGYGEVEAAKRFLRPRFDQLHDPSLMRDLDTAVERLAVAIARGETIMVHGDYDVDGMATTALLVRALGGMGARVVPFIPRRIEDGYDLSSAGVEAARACGAQLVLTADCGTNARAAVAELRAAGIDAIVSDHHLPGGPLPECVAVLNPKREGCAYPDKDLAAAGVAFKLALALARRLGMSEAPVLALLDLVALATVADVAPLRGENRVFVRYGLRLLADSRNLGLQAMLRAAGLEGKPVTAGRVGFILAPRLNAVGRLGHGLRGVELLTTLDAPEAARLARDFEELNRRRQEMDRETLAQAIERVERLPLDETYGIVLADERWHPGVIGIVASRLVEMYGRPTVLIALSGGEGRGSGRSISAFDLYGGLASCREHLIRFGGHRVAAGVTVASASVEAFAARFNAVARAQLSPTDLAGEVRVDLEVELADVTGEIEAMLRHFEPFGVGNPTPAFLARGLRVAAPPRRIARDGLRLRLSGTGAGGSDIEALAWGAADRAGELDGARPVDVVFRIERDEWQGHSRLQARITDFHV
jgi:single-stranded-DNA-specific exonuclease